MRFHRNAPTHISSSGNCTNLVILLGIIMAWRKTLPGLLAAEITKPSSDLKSRGKIEIIWQIKHANPTAGDNSQSLWLLCTGKTLSKSIWNMIAVEYRGKTLRLNARWSHYFGRQSWYKIGKWLFFGQSTPWFIFDFAPDYPENMSTFYYIECQTFE